jgi:hypothetical protein
LLYKGNVTDEKKQNDIILNAVKAYNRYFVGELKIKEKWLEYYVKIIQILCKYLNN